VAALCEEEKDDDEYSESDECIVGSVNDGLAMTFLISDCAVDGCPVAVRSVVEVSVRSPAGVGEGVEECSDGKSGG
jgi:hypothetical protein